MYAHDSFGFPSSGATSNHPPCPRQVCDSASARSFLDTYDEMVQQGKPIHRVAEYIAGSDVWGLRRDMELLASTSEFTPRLATEIVAYSSGLIDETAVEAVHRDVSREGQRVTYRTFPYVASSLRLGQNLADLKKYGEPYQELIEMRMGHISSITRRDPSLRVKHTFVKRMTRHQVYDYVYRCGRQQFIHWGTFEERMLVFAPKDRPSARDLGTRLRVDHLRSILHKNIWLSIADVHDAALQQVQHLTDTNTAILLLQQNTAVTNFYQILDPDYAKKANKLIKGSLRNKVKSMALPAQVQRYELAHVAGAAEDLQLVHPSGDPEVLDILALASWPVLRLATSKWKAVSSGFAGVLALQSPTNMAMLAEQTTDDNASALVLMERLFKSGWTYVADSSQCPAVHDLGAPKIFWTDNPVSGKPYLRCLLALPDLIASERCSGVQSHQPQKYFKELLDPSKQSLSAHAIEDSAPQRKSRTRARQDPSSSARLEKKQLGIVSELEQALVGGPVPLADLIADVAHEEPLALADEAVEAPPLGDGPLSEVVQEGPASQTVEPAIPPFAAEAEAVQEGPQHGPHVLVLPVQVEGQHIYFERHRALQVYDRIMVRCTCRRHGKCQKKRNTGPSQTNNFGPLEPYAFLGAWLRKAHRHDFASEHIQDVPTRKDVEDYYREHFL